ncbi:MAG: hypothetical protein ACFE8N_05590 [Promethearchaeota archaeon]
MMLIFSVNDYLELRLEDDKTNIYVNNELLFQCKYLLLNLPFNERRELEDGKNLNDIIERLDKSLELLSGKDFYITPEVQFWGHCSNLQTWFENKYSSSLIHRNLGFPLLKKLTEAGDYLAKKVFKEEIAKNFENGNINTVQFIAYNGYLDYLNKTELDYVFNYSEKNIIKELICQLQDYMISALDNFRQINNLLDLVCFIDLNYYQKFLIKIFKKFPTKFQLQFARFCLLHLNYKEFRDYKIPYGRFYYYFEEYITFLYENFTQIHDLLNLIDAGYYNSAFSLDEKLEYGSVSYR